MKTINFLKIALSKSTLVFLLLGCTYCLSAQNVWKGGTIGKPDQWNVASNWSKNRVPDWSETVVIPDVRSQSGYFPIIDQAVPVIAHLEIQANANLLIASKGVLQVDGLSTANCGILLQGTLLVEGYLDIMNTQNIAIELMPGAFHYQTPQQLAVDQP